MYSHNKRNGECSAPLPLPLPQERKGKQGKYDASFSDNSLPDLQGVCIFGGGKN